MSLSIYNSGDGSQERTLLTRTNPPCAVTEPYVVQTSCGVGRVVGHTDIQKRIYWWIINSASVTWTRDVLCGTRFATQNVGLSTGAASRSGWKRCSSHCAQLPWETLCKMAKERTIASYFKTSTGASKAADKDDTPSPPSSPLSPCPSNISSQTFSSPTKPPPPRQSPLKNTLTSRLSLSNDGPTICNPKPPPSSQHTSFGTSFGSSQRVVKDGQVVVTGTDGEDTESIYSFGSDDDLCRKLLGSGSPLRPSEKKGTSKIPTTPPGYKFSLEDLVTHAVDDRETEANISRLRLSFKGPGENSGTSKVNRTPKQRSRMFRDSVLASAVGEDTNTETMQRLKAAVDRTEAVDQGKTWSFFEDTISSVPPPKFPENP
ncbi:hypothetical protein CISG_06097 [Coccidioides immitis RMSCC 3703]|uniref:Uncharacterized protein n=1 Tax=Coccidioides immitis RMSCC 3703 TaxID=454286 RepID=A0A0J8R0S7_COCIT|nr:hypothetical protein CISG_06097 [Coccidioides immitis RMSCC 3703]